jgi:hypothetical protein
MRREFTVLWGVLLIVAGILFLVQSLGTVGGEFTMDKAWAGVWSVFFAGAGISFGWVFLTEPPKSWWAAIPATTLLGLSVITGASALGWEGNGTWLGAFFLGMIGLSFWLIYAVKREFWWAVIPGGALFTLAAVALFSQWVDGPTAGAIFFFGLALTFGLLALLPTEQGQPTEQGHMSWPVFPAVVLSLFGVTALFSANAAANYIWPLVLIVAGIWLLYRQFRGTEILERKH